MVLVGIFLLLQPHIGSKKEVFFRIELAPRLPGGLASSFSAEGNFRFNIFLMNSMLIVNSFLTHDMQQGVWGEYSLKISALTVWAQLYLKVWRKRMNYLINYLLRCLQNRPGYNGSVKNGYPCNKNKIILPFKYV